LPTPRGQIVLLEKGSDGMRVGLALPVPELQLGAIAPEDEGHVELLRVDLGLGCGITWTRAC
jgi:hypothetical protein